MKLDIQYLYTAKYAKWIIIGLISFFAILLIYVWSSLILSLGVSSAVPVTTQNTTPVNKVGTMDNLLSSALFGVYVPNDLNSVKKSMLDVKLVGILLANGVEDSQVIIGSASGEEKSYKLGDKIPGGALIKRITASGVLVERNGVLESLSLPKNDLTFEPAAQPLKED